MADDPWEALAAAAQSAQPADNGEWARPAEWVQPKSPASTSPPRTRLTRASPITQRNFGRRNFQTRSPSISPAQRDGSRRQFRGRDRSPRLDREASRSFGGERGFRGNRGREASRSFRGNRGRDIASRRRPDFSVSPSPDFRNRNRGERNRRSVDSRSISPDNHFRRNRGRSPFSRDKKKEPSHGPGPSWTNQWGSNNGPQSDAWGQTGGPGPSWTKQERESDVWGQSGAPGSLSPWSKAAQDIEKNYNSKEIDGWGEKLSQSGPDVWKLNNNNNNAKWRDELRGDLRRLRDSGETGEEREKWRRSRSRGRERERSGGRERDRRERSPRGRERDRDRERKDDEKEKPAENGQSSWKEGAKWRDWSINALHNSIKDINWCDFKWGDNNVTNNNINNDNDVTANQGAAENQNQNQNPTNGGVTDEPIVRHEPGPPGVDHEPGPNGNGNEILNVKLGESSSQLIDESAKLQNKPSQNEGLQNGPDVPPLMYDPWDLDSELPQSVVKPNNNSMDRLGACEPSAFNAQKVRSPTGYESSVENEIAIKPAGFEKLEDNLETKINPNLEREINPNLERSAVFEEDKEYPPLLDDPWASNEEKNSVNVTNQSNWGNDTPKQSNLVTNNVPNSSNWERNAPISPRPTNNASSSSNWERNNISSSSNWANNLSNSSNWDNVAPISSNRGNNAPNASNWGDASSSRSPNHATNVKTKSPMRPPGFENLQNNPSKPPKSQNSLQQNPKKPVPKAKILAINGNSNSSSVPKKENEMVTIFNRGITDFAVDKMEPFFVKGHISGKIYATLINKFVAKVTSAIGPVPPRTEVEVHNFLRDQSEGLIRLAHDYLSMHVGRQVVQEVARSTRGR